VRVLLIIVLFLTACSPSKRLAKLLNRNPDLIGIFDTTVYFETSSIDTSFILSNSSNRDTFVITDTKIKIYRHFDTIRIDRPTSRDSIFVNTHTIQTATEKKRYPTLIISLSLIALMFLLYMLRNIFK
jgi:hypothetical protein